MHWRNPAERTKIRAFYFVVAALGASVALTTALLLLHHYA
jgi:hypothetical protein